MNFCILLVGLFFISLPASAHQNNYEEFLIKKSEELNLRQDPRWLNMLYYERGGSIIDSKDFFLSASGKTNSQDELVATLRSFLTSNPVSFKNPYDHEQVGRCAFPARYLFLKEKLEIDESKLPKISCADLDQWYSDISPKGATLIFASSYLNNPASMFGHTFLLIDSNNTTSIRSKALNYSAETDETRGFVFAYKGIFGTYQGKFSLIPYHQMVKKYSNLESRDLWEYPLNLNEQELKIILYNIWEVGPNYADYYFFSENCSYLLLKLLEIVRPQIKYEKKLINWIIPSDTVKEISAVQGLIQEKKFRPSRVSKIKSLMENSSQTTQKIAKKIALEQDLENSESKYLADLSLNDKKILYELAYEYQQYSYSKQQGGDRNNMAKTALKILQERSVLLGDTKLEKNYIPNTDPILGHDTSRLNIFGGYEKDNHQFLELGIRPAYHELLDGSLGFLEGSQIQLLEGSARYYSDQNEFEFNHLSLIDIKSHSARNLFFKPTSWELNVGAQALYVNDRDYQLFDFLSFYPGLNYQIPQLNSDVTFLFGSDLYYSQDTKHPVSPSYGFYLSTLTTYEKWITQINIKDHNFINDNFDYVEYELKQSLAIAKNISLRLEYNRKNFKNYRDDNVVKLGVSKYF